MDQCLSNHLRTVPNRSEVSYIDHRHKRSYKLTFLSYDYWQVKTTIRNKSALRISLPEPALPFSSGTGRLWERDFVDSEPLPHIFYLFTGGPSRYHVRMP